MIDTTWVGDIPESDKEVLMQWFTGKKMDIGDTRGEHIQLPNGHYYDFRIFRADTAEYEITFERDLKRFQCKQRS